MLWAGLVFARQNFLYDYTEATMPVEGGNISIRLFGKNKIEDKPKKVRYRSNPYSLSIRYIAHAPFDHAAVSNLKFMRQDNGEIIFEHLEMKSKRKGKPDEYGYAGFYYGDISETFKLEYVNYAVVGSITVYDHHGKAKIWEIDVILETDYKEKTTWDFLEGIMGI